MFFVMVLAVLSLTACNRGWRTVQPGRHVEAAGRFSFVPPSGWRTAKLDGMKFNLFGGEEIDGLAATISFVEEIFEESLESFIDKTLEVSKKVDKTFQILSREDVTLSSGLKAVKVVTTGTPTDLSMRQVLYFVDDVTRKLIIVCTRSESAGEQDALMEKSVNTFRLERG